MTTLKRFAPAALLTLGLLLVIQISSFAITNAQKPKTRHPHAHPPALTRAEMKGAEARLAEMGYGTGRNALISFQKYEGRKITGQLSRDDLNAIRPSLKVQASAAANTITSSGA